MAKHARLGIVPVFVLLFALLLVFNFLTPMTADDYLFTFSHDHWSRLTGVDEIVPSMAALRQNTNGRVFAHFFVQLFLLWPRWIFNVLNAGLGTLLFYILYRYVRCGDARRDLAALLFLAGALFVLLPAFGQVFLWLTGACNYLWTAVLTLAFLYPFYARYFERESLRSPALRVLYLILGFFAGGWSENGSLAMLCAAFGFLALTWLREKRLPRFLTLSFLVTCAGFLFLMSAPSEWSGRRGEVAESTLTRAAAKLWAAVSARLPGALIAALALLALAALALLVWLIVKKRRLGCRLCMALIALVLLAGLALFWRKSGSVAAFVSEPGACLLTAGALWLLLMLRGLARGLDARTLLAALLLGLAGLASVLIFLVAVYFPARSACPFLCYTTLADATLLVKLWERGEKRDLRALAALFTLLALLLLPLAVSDIVSVHRQSAARDQYLRSLGPEDDAVVEPVITRSKYPATWPGDEDYFSGDIAYYYGLHGFAVTDYVND